MPFDCSVYVPANRDFPFAMPYLPYRRIDNSAAFLHLKMRLFLRIRNERTSPNIPTTPATIGPTNDRQIWWVCCHTHTYLHVFQCVLAMAFVWSDRRPIALPISFRVQHDISFRNDLVWYREHHQRSYSYRRLSQPCTPRDRNYSQLRTVFVTSCWTTRRSNFVNK